MKAVQQLVTTIPAGYRVSVTSWENDGDNYNTEILEGLSKEAVMFIVAFCHKFWSQNDHTHPGCFGNMYEPSDAKLDAVIFSLRDLITTNLTTISEILECDPDEVAEGFDDDVLEDIINEVHDSLFGCGSDGFRFRVFDSIKIEHIAAPIVMLNVTNEFVAGK